MGIVEDVPVPPRTRSTCARQPSWGLWSKHVLIQPRRRGLDLRIAFDFDGVLAGDSFRAGVLQDRGLEEYQESEYEAL